MTKIFQTPKTGNLCLHSGTQCKRWKKEIARVGRYEKPADNLKFEFTRDWLKGRVDTFNRMKANGVRIPAPLDHSNDTSKNQGWVEDLYLDGDKLYGIFDLYGDGADLPMVSDVSLHAPPSWRDGNGNDYEWPIRHVALTSTPCLTGLEGWQELALSAEEYDNLDILTYQPETPMAYEKFATALGLTLDSEEDAEQKIVDAILELKATPTNPEPTPEPDPEPTPEPQPSDPPAPLPDPANPLLLSLAADNRKMKLDAITGVKINQSQREKLDAKYCGEALGLTLSEGREDDFDDVYLILSEGPDLMPIGEATKGQTTLKLDDGTNDDDERKAAGEAMRKAAGVE